MHVIVIPKARESIEEEMANMPDSDYHGHRGSCDEICCRLSVTPKYHRVSTIFMDPDATLLLQLHWYRLGYLQWELKQRVGCLADSAWGDAPDPAGAATTCRLLRASVEVVKPVSPQGLSDKRFGFLDELPQQLEGRDNGERVRRRAWKIRDIVYVSSKGENEAWREIKLAQVAMHSFLTGTNGNAPDPQNDVWQSTATVNDPEPSTWRDWSEGSAYRAWVEHQHAESRTEMVRDFEGVHGISSTIRNLAAEIARTGTPARAAYELGDALGQLTHEVWLPDMDLTPTRLEELRSAIETNLSFLALDESGEARAVPR